MGSLLPKLYLMGSMFSLQKDFFCAIPWRGIDVFCYPLGVSYMVQFTSFLTLTFFGFRMISCSYFILLFYRYLLLWVLVFCKLRRLSGQPAEAKALAYGARFEGLRDIGKVFEGLDQEMGRVRQGRVGRSRLSCRSYGSCPLPAVSSTVFKVGVCH